MRYREAFEDVTVYVPNLRDEYLTAISKYEEPSKDLVRLVQRTYELMVTSYSKPIPCNEIKEHALMLMCAELNSGIPHKVLLSNFLKNYGPSMEQVALLEKGGFKETAEFIKVLAKEYALLLNIVL